MYIWQYSRQYARQQDSTLGSTLGSRLGTGSRNWGSGGPFLGCMHMLIFWRGTAATGHLHCYMKRRGCRRHLWARGGCRNEVSCSRCFLSPGQWPDQSKAKEPYTQCQGLLPLQLGNMLNGQQPWAPTQGLGQGQLPLLFLIKDGPEINKSLINNNNKSLLNLWRSVTLLSSMLWILLADIFCSFLCGH